MNHCQNQFSCFSCCGLWNLKLSDLQKKELLDERTEELKKYYKKENQFYRNHLLLYRKYREKKEKNIPRFNYEIYVCPFLGWISPEQRIGCLIHPSITGEKKSQDVSFYGSSICLSYDCRVKEMDAPSFSYLILIQKVIKNFFSNSSQWEKHFIYSRLIADYTFYRFVDFYFALEKIKNSQEFNLFYELCYLRLQTQESLSITSFEIHYNRYVKDQNHFEEDFKKIFSTSIEKKNLLQKYQKLFKKQYVNKNSSS